MRVAALFVVVICVAAACHKNTDGSASAILMRHLWYPYQVHIHSIDSNWVTTTDSMGNVQQQSKVSPWDTTFLASECQQKSTYYFQHGGISTVNDLCGSQLIHSTWSVNQFGLLDLPLVEVMPIGSITYSTGGFGLIGQINDAQFTFNQPQKEQIAIGTSNGPNGTTIQTMDKQDYSVSVTFKSR
jgi:hypothetical protein